VLRFLLRRLVVAIPTLFLVVTLAFFMMRAAPGNPYDGERSLPPEIEAAVKRQLRLDEPVVAQYGRYLADVARGDLGPSLKYRDKRVWDFIREGFPKSLAIGLPALILALVVGMSLGVVAALRQNRAPDYAATAVAILGVCIPTFVTAPLLILLFGSILGWVPSGGWQAAAAIDLGGWKLELPRFANVALPILVLALPQVAVVSRLTRAGMIEALRSNHVRTARAKGLPEWLVVRRHALRAAVIPLVSYLGPAMAALITGSLVVEKIFQLPGLGRAFVIGALQRDYTLVMGVVILYATLIIALNLVSDLITAALDPRVRLS
jgi:oligopeptide transport system permease protein